jgi:hypothetical protein
MNEFHVEIRGGEIKDAVIIQAIQAEEIVSDSDGAVAERLVKLLARGVSDERNLRPIAQSRQLSGEIILRRPRDLGGSRQKWNQEEEKECEAGVQEFRSCRSSETERENRKNFQPTTSRRSTDLFCNS